MTSAKELKRDLRKQALARRDALDAFWRIEASLEMAETARDGIAVDGTSIVSGFWPMRSEVDVRPLMFALREHGARLCLPAIIDTTTIVFRELVRGAALVDMGFGTAGPGDEHEVLDPTIMLVPLAAFDARGHRIGYGAGYYDRAIARLADMGRDPAADRHRLRLPGGRPRARRTARRHHSGNPHRKRVAPFRSAPIEGRCGFSFSATWSANPDERRCGSSSPG